MLAEEIIYYLIWVAPAIAIFLMAYKVYALKEARSKQKLYVRLKMINLYSEEQIVSASSVMKRDFMIKSNRLTMVIYLCMIPVTIFLLVNLIEDLKSLIDKI